MPTRLALAVGTPGRVLNLTRSAWIMRGNLLPLGI
jgi:hypothetical protein